MASPEPHFPISKVSYRSPNHGLKSWNQYQFRPMIFNVNMSISDINIGNIGDIDLDIGRY